MELDHIFIRANKGAPGAEALLDFGLREGSKNRHPGQGTANRRFFFQNMMIELIWIADEMEVQNERTLPLRLFERLNQAHKNISPFGVCFRPSEGEDEKAPFPAWEYKPIYLPGQLAIEVGCDIPLQEPMWFYASFARRPDGFPVEKREPLQHELPLKEVTSAGLHMNIEDEFSETAKIVNEVPGFAINSGGGDLLELEFDNGLRGKRHDFRPVLPLVFSW